MQELRKEHTRIELLRQCELSSQTKMANKLRVSTATVSHILNHKWALIRPEMWRKVQIGLKLDFDWNIVKTTNFNTLVGLLELCQFRSLSIGISENAGIGKTEAYKYYQTNFKNVVLVECKNHWTKKSYVRALLIALGLETHGTTEDLINRFVDHLKGLERPLVIIDQADKLKDPQLDLFMDFYNELPNHCGFVLSGVKSLQKRVLRGVQRDKVGYLELFSRIGSKFYSEISALSLADVQAICRANGVQDEEFQTEVYNISLGDIRTVRRQVEKYKQLHKKKEPALN